jgi:flagellar hook-associated protein 2
MGLSAPGIGSNLDINTMVSQLMALEGRKMTAMQTQEASYQAKVSAFGQVKSAFATFQSAVSSLATVQQFQSTTATASDATVLSAKATASATPGTYALEVSKLAQAQKLVTAGQASTTAAIGTGTITFDFGTLTGPNDAGGNATAPVKDPATGKYTSAVFTPGTADAKTVTIGPNNSSLAGIRDAINGAKIGVNATIVNDGGASPNRLVLTNTTTGAASSMKITVGNDSGGGLSSLLGHDPAASASDPAGSAGQHLSETMAAQDALMTIDGLPVKKSSNTISDVISGVTLNLTKTNVGTPTTVTVARDTASVVTAVNKFVTAYNAISKTFKDASAYDATTRTAAILNGDSSIRGAQAQLRAVMSAPIAGGYGEFSRLSEVGVAFQKDGTLAVDSAKLNKALESNFNDVAGLFAAAGKATDSLASYATSSSDTKAGAYALKVTALATQTSVAGTANADTGYAAPANILSLTINGKQGDIKLNADYNGDSAALAADLQSKINGSSAFGGAVMKVESVDGKITITSDAYGSKTSLIVGGTALAALFGANPVLTPGKDIEGTINGQAATGSGRILTAQEGDAKGLQVSVTGGITGDRGTINFSRGYASQFAAMADNFIGEKGSFSSRMEGLNASITSLKKREDAEQARLINKEAALRKQFTALDTQISSLNSLSSYLTQQLTQIANLTSSN